MPSATEPVDRLIVVIGGSPVGDLHRPPNGAVALTYRPGHLADPDPVPLSVSAPCREGPYDVTAWIDGLLPDSEQVRVRWMRQFGAASTAPFDLLASPIGRDCAGAVRFCAEDDLEGLLTRPGGVEELSEGQIAARLKLLREDHASWQPQPRPGRLDGFSLAGWQPKTALRYADGSWGRPYGDEATTHILKPSARPEMPDLDLVEHLTMAAARNLGLDAAVTWCQDFGSERTLVVARYDRVERPDGVGRVHQEDMCQALGIPPALKYQSDGGPGPDVIARLIKGVASDPDGDRRAFRDALIYGWLVASPDGHAKNYALMLSRRQVRLAPLYDVCSVLPYAEPPRLPGVRMAMKTGEDYTIREADKHPAAARLAALLGLEADETLARAHDLAAGLPDAITRAVDDLPDRQRRAGAVGVMHRRVTERARRRPGLGRRPPPARPTAGGRPPAGG